MPLLAETLKQYITDFGATLRYSDQHEDKTLAGRVKGKAMKITDLEKAGFSYAQIKKLERSGEIQSDFTQVKNLFGKTTYKLYWVPIAPTEEFLNAAANG